MIVFDHGALFLRVYNVSSTSRGKSLLWNTVGFDNPLMHHVWQSCVEQVGRRNWFQRGFSYWVQSMTNALLSLFLYLQKLHFDHAITAFDSGRRLKKTYTSVRTERIISSATTHVYRNRGCPNLFCKTALLKYLASRHERCRKEP